MQVFVQRETAFFSASWSKMVSLPSEMNVDLSRFEFDQHQWNWVGKFWLPASFSPKRDWALFRKGYFFPVQKDLLWNCWITFPWFCRTLDCLNWINESTHSSQWIWTQLFELNSQMSHLNWFIELFPLVFLFFFFFECGFVNCQLYKCEHLWMFMGLYLIWCRILGIANEWMNNRVKWNCLIYFEFNWIPITVVWYWTKGTLTIWYFLFFSVWIPINNSILPLNTELCFVI